MLYSGPIIHDFIIDRLAIGLPPNVIIHDFKSVFGSDLTEKDIQSISDGYKDEIQEREDFFRSELAKVSPDISIRLNNMSKELEKAMVELSNDKDYKTFVSFAGTWLKNIELLGRLLGKFEQKVVNEKNINYIQIANITAEEMDKFKKKKEKRKKLLLEELR